MISHRMKEAWKHLIGKRIRLVVCKDPYTKLKAGTLGTVTDIDSMNTVHVKWDTGEHLGMVYEDGDRWSTIDDNF